MTRHRISFEELVTGLNARQSGVQWIGRCPAHDDRSPSLSLALRNGRLLLHCFAGCEFAVIADALARRGLWPVVVEPGHPINANRLSALRPDLYQSLLKIDARLKPANNTRVDRYLANRGILIRSPKEIGHHPKLFHPWSGTSWPAMVAIVRDVSGLVTGFHRTYLGYGEPITKAKIDPVRATLGSLSGNSVHLAPAGSTLLIGEGIETVLSAMQLYRLPGWAALTANNLEYVTLPNIVRSVIVLADNDAPGLHAAIKAAQRYRREGFKTQLIRPQEVNDFNDLLLQQQRGENSDD